LPDAAVDGVTGFVVPPGDIHAMADSVATLLENEPLCREFGENAKRRVQRHFDAAQNSRQLQEQILKYARPARTMELRGAHVRVS
jgi:glycosyltransferase involved in cell wall biosynthesis